MFLYPLGFIFTLAYSVIALRSAINMSDDNLILISCAKGICKIRGKMEESEEGGKCVSCSIRPSI